DNNDSDSEEIEELVLEEHVIKIKDGSDIKKGASTPYTEDETLMLLIWWLSLKMPRLFTLGFGLHKRYVRNRPWSLLGNFSAAFYLDDKSISSSNVDISMREFKECEEDIGVSNVDYTRLKYMWNQKPKGDDGILKKINRIMANLDFNDVFVGAHAIFQSYCISDHSPAILKIPMVFNSKLKTFKFSNVLIHNVHFKDVVKDEWSFPVSGSHMYQVVKKLKHLKKPLRKLLFDLGNLYQNVKRLLTELDQVQLDLDKDPFNQVLHKEDAVYVKAFNDALVLEDQFLKRKAKIEWLRVGDSNSAYFYKVEKGRTNRSKIDVVFNMDGNYLMGDQVPMTFVATLSTQDVKEAIFSMGDDKSTCPDGYTAAFFKEAWDIMSTDVTKVVKEFFINGTLLKEEGRLPVKYMGVHLISSRLVYRDCKELIEKVWGRIHDWKNKSLSTAAYEGSPLVSRGHVKG
nr:hypothetical protein [Tanacetum cinerariifolium]